MKKYLFTEIYIHYIYTIKSYFNFFCAVKKKGIARYARRRTELEAALPWTPSGHIWSSSDTHYPTDRAAPMTRRHCDSNGHTCSGSYDDSWREYAHYQDHRRRTHTNRGYLDQRYEEPWEYPGSDVGYGFSQHNQTEKHEGQWGWGNAKLFGGIIMSLFFLALVALVCGTLEDHYMPVLWRMVTGFY